MVFLKEFAPKLELRQPPNTYLKKTLICSSVVIKFFTDFTVCTNKPLEGLASTSVNDEADQSLHDQEQDSCFSNDLGDDDALMGLDLGDDLFLHTEPKDHTSVSVIVKLTSININSVQFPLSSSVADAICIKGSHGSQVGEDSLLISLRSGLLLLVRIWKVPRTVLGIGSPFYNNALPETPHLHVYKPFVVQWWRLTEHRSSELAASSLSCHSLGLAVVSASPLSLFKIHMTEMTDLGLSFKPHFNVPVDGVILHSCFAEPYHGLNPSNQILFLTVTFTEQKRLVVTLYSWLVTDQLVGNLQQTSLPLNNSFQFPIMIIPLARNSSFLFVCPDNFYIITAHNIWSADYSFKHFPSTIPFPTAFCTKARSADDLPSEDLIFLSTTNGQIYCVTISQTDDLIVEPWFKINDQVSLFTVVPRKGSGCYVEYSSDTGGCKKLFFPHYPVGSALNHASGNASEGTVTTSHQSWSPIIDVALVDLPKPFGGKELWAITGLDKKTKLSNFLSGYTIRKDTRCYSELRKNENLFYFGLKDRHFLVLTLSFASKLVEYSLTEIPTKDGEEVVTEIETPFFESSVKTIYCGVLSGNEIMVQFVSQGVLFSDFNKSRFESFGERELLRVNIIDDVAIMIFGNGCDILLEIFRIVVDPTLSESSEQLYFEFILSSALKADFCSFHSVISQQTLMIFVGYFDGSFSIQQINLQENLSESIEIRLGKDSEDEALSFEQISPCSFAFIENMGYLYVGTLSGRVFCFNFDRNFEPTLTMSYNLGSCAVEFYRSQSDPNFLIAVSSSIYMFNLYSSPAPGLVLFNERLERAVILMAELPNKDLSYLSFAFLRDDGVVFGSVFTHKTPLIRQLSLYQSAKKLIYFQPTDLFVIFCRSKKTSASLMLVERKGLRNHSYLNAGHSQKLANITIFKENEEPLCAHIWSIMRQDRVSKKLMVGCLVGAEGALKIIDLRKLPNKEESVSFELQELYTLKHELPIACICQIDATVYFCSGSLVYSTLYNLEQKRLGELKKVADLPSQVVSIASKDNVLLVNTLQDSVYLFDTRVEEENAGKACFKVLYNDPVPRSLVNGFCFNSRIIASDKLHSKLLVLDTSPRSQLRTFSYKFPFISRIYDICPSSGKTDCREAEMLCVGVSGDIVSISILEEESSRLVSFKKKLKDAYLLSSNETVSELIERLNRPFTDKVTGKGLHNVNRPFFDYWDQGKVINLDVDELQIHDDHSSNSVEVP